MNKNASTYCNLIAASTKAVYDSIGSVYCPALKEVVVFNARGFHHLNYKPGGTARDVSERVYKLSLFPLAIPVIKNATAVDKERNIKIRLDKKKAAFKDAKTYALVALVGRKRPIEVRVVLLRIGTGKLMFFSIMKD